MKWLAFVGLLLLSHSLRAQGDSVSFRKVPDKYWLKSIVQDAGKAIVFPRYIRKEDTPFLVNCFLISASFIPADEAVSDMVSKNQNGSLTSFSKNFLDPWGNGLFTLPVAGLTWLTGHLMQDSRTADIGLKTVRTTILAMGASRVPKVLFQRHRPRGSTPDAYQFEGPFKGFTGNYSFPSGHAFIAFSTVSSVAPDLKDKKWLVAGLYTLASAVTLGRVYQNEHWLSDAVTGAVSGYVFGRLIWRLDNLKAARR